MKIWLIIVVLHTTKVVVKKKNQAWIGDSNPSCVYGLSNIHLNWSLSTTLDARVFFLVGGDRIERRSQVVKRPSREGARKKYYELTKWPALRWLDSSVGRGLHRYRTGQIIASRSYKARDISLRDVQTVQVSNMLARDSIGNFASFGH